MLLVVPDPLSNLPATASEAERITDCLNPFGSLVEITTLEGRDATVARFEQKIRSRRFHLLHYAGHSQWAEDTGRSCLLLQDKHGNPQPLFLDELSSIFDDAESPLSFCYLSSCKGASAGDSLDTLQYDFLGIADSLVRAGIPAVLGFREQVGDDLAEDFAGHFYSNLFQPRREFNLPRSLLYARKKIFREWSMSAFIPVLVMQS